MSVIGQQVIQRLDFPGSRVLGEPSGIWRADAFETGDGTAGFLEMDFVFNLATAPIGALLYSLDQYAVFVGGASADRECFVSTTLMGRSGLAFNLRWAFNLRRMDAADQSGITPSDSNGFRGILLGVPVTQGATSSLNTQVPNVDTEVLQVHASGYVWDQVAQQQPGGPVRPLKGLYR